MIFDRVLTRAESTDVLNEVMSRLTARRFHARVIVQESTVITQWHLEIDKDDGNWFACSDAGDVHEFRDGRMFDNGSLIAHATSIVDAPLLPLALVFPETLMIWGQHPGAFQPRLVEKLGNRSLLITSHHPLDHSMQMTVVVDEVGGFVSRIMNFNAPYLIVAGLELGRGIERRIPSAFAQLDVVIPDY
ncbi:hypothetical protein [Microbacterium gorillae]|uniref:hypothetical protein n=1 Tax=Microbacterium gorillae TaxID=1231063 RepID=UPI003D986F1C